MIVHMKKFFIVIPIIIFLLLASADVYFYFFRKNLQSSLESQTSHPPCLSDNETVDYTINWRQDVTPVDIIIKDKKSGNEISRFSINSILPVYYPVQPRKCGVYVLRVFNYNPEINKQAPGYRDEIWKYDYSGKGEPLLLLSEKPKEFISYYSLVFQVDPREIYIALVRGYLEREDYALVIKDLNLRVDSFVLLRQTLFEKYPDLLGYFGLESWTKNGDYFWGDLSIGANEIAYLRILRELWELDVLPAPAGTLGGTAFNPEFGYVTYDTGPGWIGIHEVAEQVYDEWRKAGKKVDFYLYNLFTKEKILLATTTDPSWSFKPKWLSNLELEYYLPSGERKVYKIIK